MPAPTPSVDRQLRPRAHLVNASDGGFMSISLAQKKAITELAAHLYGYLPGTAHPYAQQAISFRGAAAKVGVGHLWPGGSKEPAIVRLLTDVLEQESKRFVPLIEAIVSTSMEYPKRHDELTYEEVLELNKLLTKVGFGSRELTSREFLESLPRRAKPPGKTAPKPTTLATFSDLKRDLASLGKLSGQKRGYAFEAFLNALFTASGLAPREPFRLVGEQVDGSIELDSQTYLVEAKYESGAVAQDELLVFRGKVESKAVWSRGLMISYSGFTDVGLEQFARGRPTNIVCMNGKDLYFVLDGELDLAEVLRIKARRAAETNDAYVDVEQLAREHQARLRRKS